jgi:hypothetical protein
MSMDSRVRCQFLARSRDYVSESFGIRLLCLQSWAARQIWFLQGLRGIEFLQSVTRPSPTFPSPEIYRSC